MANVISPFGALDFVHQGGSQRTEELATKWIGSSDLTPIFYGDLVQPNLGATFLTGGVGPYITQGCSAGSTAVTTQPGFAGVFRGCEFFNPTTQRMQFSRYWPGAGVAGTSSVAGDIKAFVQADCNMRYIIQGSSIATLGSSSINAGLFVAVGGTIAGVSSAGGNTTTGNSGMSIASSETITLTSTVVAPFRLVDFYSNNAPGSFVPSPASGIAGSFLNGVDNTTAGQYFIVAPWSWEGNGP